MYLGLIIAFAVALVSAQDSWVVSTENGDMRGYWSEEYNVWSFRGVPYAVPPVGNLRFKAPVPPHPWSGVFNATDTTKMCPQSYVGSEDCLIVNVYVPESAKTGSVLPVLFFTHGGGLNNGNSNTPYNPSWTTRHDVILITFNYRLNSLGYLCLGTERVPGNAGVKDLVEALRWTNKHIASFGGDPNAVTVYGESAGSIIVESLLLVKQANGLFHRVIMEGGSVLVDVGFNYNCLGQAKSTALKLGFSYVDDLDRLGEFYENAPVQDILDGSNSLCIENEIDGVEAAIVDDVKEAFETGNYNKVPVIFAHSEIEGILFGGNFWNDIDDLNNNFVKFLPRNLVFPSETEKLTAAERIKRAYFGNTTITTETKRGYLDLMGDQIVVNPQLRAAMYHSSNSDNPVYMMEFSHTGGFNLPHVYFPEITGASHADITAHVMDLGYDNNVTPQDHIVRDNLTELWTNFVKYGDPTPATSSLPVQWRPFTWTEQYYLSVGSEMVLRQYTSTERAELWSELYDAYYFPVPKCTSISSGRSEKFTILVFICSLPICLRTLLISGVYFDN